MTRIVLSPLDFISLTLHHSSLRRILYLSPFYGWRNRLGDVKYIFQGHKARKLWHLTVIILYLWRTISTLISFPEYCQICYNGLKSHRLQIPHGTESCHAHL